MDSKKQSSIGFKMIMPDGNTIDVCLKNSFITPEKDIESPELLKMKDEFAKVVSEHHGDIGLAFAKEFAQNEEDGKVGHWVYLGGGVGFVFHHAMDHESIWEGIRVMLKAIEPFASKATEVRIPDPLNVISSKVGNA